ncbi:UBA/TS-N domain containing protein [Acanthamoeba castellanii str. Neff]|uniref:UBA/TS-N domain containing protein n=1 Tax=Acanthamoeba castellanii (strain ATCC 30010 / Neff) TaxID=1257118 RepID=L8GUR2_ACACF|nr:UBA/TS-N domain containing protein [Acanthamoeba castellanii str. Neff]ELR16657.1 UBA/TS-N domain containing protein [Acanthamoeba castellanii str. Neff]
MKRWEKVMFCASIDSPRQIEQVKASIERAKGFEAKRQKLDDATVASLNLHENDHLILLVPLVKEEVLDLPFEAPFLTGAAAPTAAPVPTPTTPPVAQPQPIVAPAVAPPVALGTSPGAAPIPIPGGGQLDLQRMLMELATAFTASTGGQTPPGAVPPILTIPPVVGGPFAVGSPSTPTPSTPPQPAAVPAPAPVAPPAEPALPEPKPEDIQMLTEMGFPAERAKKALWLHRMNLEVAMEWLLMHSEDPDADAPLTAEQKRQLVAIYGPMQTIDPRVQQAIAANVCTYAVTGPHYASQTWYQCYTCNLSGNEGCCEACARVCHKGHQLSRPRTSSSFYCDCGAGVHSFKCRALRVPTVSKSSDAS